MTVIYDRSQTPLIEHIYGYRENLGAVSTAWYTSSLVPLRQHGADTSVCCVTRAVNRPYMIDHI